MRRLISIISHMNAAPLIPPTKRVSSRSKIGFGSRTS